MSETKQGLLWKSKEGFFKRSWKQRWVKLERSRADGLHFAYSEEQGDPFPLGIIRLDGYSVNKLDGGPRPHAFALQPEDPSRPRFEFAAPSADELDEWLAALGQAITVLAKVSAAEQKKASEEADGDSATTTAAAAAGDDDQPSKKSEKAATSTKAKATGGGSSKKKGGGGSKGKSTATTTTTTTTSSSAEPAAAKKKKKKPTK